MSQTGWTPVQEDTSAWTPVEEAPSAKPEPGFASKIAAAAEKSHFGAGEFADPEHPAHTLLKLAMHDIENGEYSKGANGLLGAAAEFLKPTLPLTVAAAPISSALAFGGSALASKGMQIGARALGATPEQATLAGNIGGIAGGAGIGKLSSLAADTGLANRMYRSALKVPPSWMPAAKVEQVADTALREGIPVSPGGREKLGSLMDDLNTRIADRIQEGAGKGVTVSPQAVASRLGDVESRFATQVNPKADLAAIEASRKEFLASQPADIPATQAQALKQGTYQQLKSKAYGELKSADIESQKALARGLKEELARQIPEIGDLNARESQLIGLDKALERAVNRISNHQMFGIGTPLAAAGVKAATGSTGLAAVTGILRAVIDDPIIKSKLAIAMSRRGVPGAAINSRLGAYSAALAGAATAQPQTGPASGQGNE